MQPSTCIVAPSGLTTTPMSWAQTTRSTLTAPLARSTFTSTASAA